MIEDLKKSAEWQKEMQAIKTAYRKEPRLFHPQNSTAVEDWKYDSGWIAGFDFLYSILTGGKK